MSAQEQQQFLNGVLSRRGPSSLPYAEDAKWLIRQHLMSLLSEFPSLHAQTSTFTHNDGRTSHLLRADGTVPMTYHSVTYNIPIVIWLMESYPRHPPSVFVNPTRDMVIKRSHPHVNPSGLVSIPYLHSWVYPTSNLLDLSRHLSRTFSLNPPLFSRNPNPSFQNPNPSYPPQSRSEDPSDVYHRNAIHKLVDSLHSDITTTRKACELEMDDLFSLQSILRHRGDEVSCGVREMLDEKEGLERGLQTVLMNSDVTESWVRENGGKCEGTDEFMFEAMDGLSRQMMESSASDLAIEDTVYALDRAVQDGAIPFDQYLRNVRLLSREQFFHRATCAKVRSAQMHAQVTNMASRSSYAS